MSEKEAIEQSLQTERQMLQRQKLFRQLWNLSHDKESSKSQSRRNILGVERRHDAIAKP